MNIEIRRSRRRTMSVEINTDAKIIVRAPLQMLETEINRFLNEKADWINKNVEKAKQRKEKDAAVRKLTTDDLHQLSEQACMILPEKTAFYAEKMGVTYGRITIRNQKSRWGSCSAKGNLNFNCLLMLTPERVQDYVIVHELCHRKQMNHSKLFWNEVEKMIPDYRERRGWLKEHGNGIINSMLNGKG